MASYKEVRRKAPWWLTRAWDAMTPYRAVQWDRSSDDDGLSFSEDGRQVAKTQSQAEVLGSKWPGYPGEGYHVVVLDLDRDHCEFELVPSSTDGNGHLYFHTQVSWDKVLRLLDALEDCGILQPGYVRAAKERGELMVRPPWIRKGTEKDDAQRAFEESLEIPKPYEEHFMTLEEYLDADWDPLKPVPVF